MVTLTAAERRDSLVATGNRQPDCGPLKVIQFHLEASELPDKRGQGMQRALAARLLPAPREILTQGASDHFAR